MTHPTSIHNAGPDADDDWAEEPEENTEWWLLPEQPIPPLEDDGEPLEF